MRPIDPFVGHEIERQQLFLERLDQISQLGRRVARIQARDLRSLPERDAIETQPEIERANLAYGCLEAWNVVFVEGPDIDERYVPVSAIDGDSLDFT